MNTIKDLINYNNEFDKKILIIRHSNRNKIPIGVHDIITPINNSGKINAKNTGKFLKKINILKIYTSPVERCLETAKYILEGYGNSNIIIERSSLLGEPGPYVFNRNIAKNHFIKFSTKIVVEKQIKGENLIGIKSIDEGSSYFWDFLYPKLKNIKNKNDVIIFVTHDAILAPMIYFLTGEKFGNNNWVNFLDGFILATKGEDLFIIRSGNIKKYNGSNS